MQVAQLDFNTTNEYDRSVVQGDPFEMLITLYQDEAMTTPFPLTDYDSVEMLIRKTADPSSPLLATPVCSFVDKPTGKIKIAMTKETTRAFRWLNARHNIRLIKDGSPTTFGEGHITVKPTVFST